VAQKLSNYKSARSTAGIANFKYLDMSLVIEFKRGLGIALFLAKKK
jgi:hypothetical protein